MLRSARVWFLIALMGAGPGCGYTLQRSRSPQLDEEGIHTVYVAPIVNNTYKVGIENVIYNELVRSLLAHRSVRLVEKAENADAVLGGSVNGASYANSAAAPANRLNPVGSGPSDVLVATQYTAILQASFTLERPNPPPGKRKILWSSGFTRSQNFLASNQLGIFGTTSPLINDSEFDRVLREMSQNMMADLHESMLAMF
jgi:hypothetical protein